MMDITQIKQWSKIKKGKKGASDKLVNHVRVKYKEGNKDIDLHEFDLPSRPARAVPEFYKCFDDLRVFVCDICEFPEEDSAKLRINGVSISWHEATKNSDEKTGVIFSCSRSLDNGPNDLHFNTPLRYDTHPDPGQCLPDGTMDIIEDLIEHAEKYVGGEREQAEMDLDQESRQEESVEENVPESVED
jgi:hypothetical protein